MKNYILERNLSLIEDFSYHIYKDNNLIYTASKEPDIRSLDKFMTELTGLSLTIPVKDMEDNTIFTIKKIPSTPFSLNNFRIITKNYRYNVREGNNYTVPDLIIILNKRRLQICGEIREQTFYIKDDSKEVVKLKAEVVSDKKKYFIEILEEFENDEAISIAAAIILDTLYPNH